MGPKNEDENAGCDTNLCRSCDGVTDLQEVHRSNTCVVVLSMFGKSTLDLSSPLVFVNPKYPTGVEFIGSKVSINGR